MATNLGKRKRGVADAPSSKKPDDSQEPGSPVLNAQEIFRRHFEAQFKPLPATPKPTLEVVEHDSDDEPEEDSEWDGIPSEEENEIQVIEHRDNDSKLAMMSKSELKAFMVSLRPDPSCMQRFIC